MTARIVMERIGERSRVGSLFSDHKRRSGLAKIPGKRLPSSNALERWLEKGQPAQSFGNQTGGFLTFNRVLQRSMDQRGKIELIESDLRLRAGEPRITVKRGVTALVQHFRLFGEAKTCPQIGWGITETPGFLSAVRFCGKLGLTIQTIKEAPMEIVPLGPGFAAELRGVTLAEIAANDAAYKEARAAFEEHSVLVFRGQDVTDEAQIAFSRRFGPLEVTPTASPGAGTHLVILSTMDKDGKVVPADHRIALRNKANQLWHTDSTFKSVPALASVLSARIIPAHGGETEYVSTRLAWDRIDPALRRQLANSFAWHDYSHSRAKIAPDIVSADERAALPPHCWRMMWRNPVNGRSSLYIASHAYAIEGMEQAAAQKLLAALIDAATAPGSSYVHTWREGDVVMWDNRATLHRGRPWPAHEARLMVRTTISATAADGVESMRPPSRQAAE
jgi:alpha-ketoglutarate-dependent 2,4-dichlorophenoxyacetate dioxygenase